MKNKIYIFANNYLDFLFRVKIMYAGGIDKEVRLIDQKDWVNGMRTYKIHDDNNSFSNNNVFIFFKKSNARK